MQFEGYTRAHATYGVDKAGHWSAEIGRNVAHSPAQGNDGADLGAAMVQASFGLIEAIADGVVV